MFLSHKLNEENEYSRNECCSLSVWDRPPALGNLPKDSLGLCSRSVSTRNSSPHSHVMTFRFLYYSKKFMPFNCKDTNK